MEVMREAVGPQVENVLATLPGKSGELEADASKTRPPPGSARAPAALGRRTRAGACGVMQTSKKSASSRELLALVHCDGVEVVLRMRAP